MCLLIGPRKVVSLRSRLTGKLAWSHTLTRLTPHATQIDLPEWASIRVSKDWSPFAIIFIPIEITLLLGLVLETIRNAVVAHVFRKWSYTLGTKNTETRHVLECFISTIYFYTYSSPGILRSSRFLFKVKRSFDFQRRYQHANHAKTDTDITSKAKYPINAVEMVCSSIPDANPNSLMLERSWTAL